MASHKVSKTISIMERLVMEAAAKADAGTFWDIEDARTLYVVLEPLLRPLMKKLRPSTLGEIGVKGISYHSDYCQCLHHTSLYEVRWATRVGKYDSGRAILLNLAMSAVVAYAWDWREMLLGMPERHQTEVAGW